MQWRNYKACEMELYTGIGIPMGRELPWEVYGNKNSFWAMGM